MFVYLDEKLSEGENLSVFFCCLFVFMVYLLFMSFQYSIIAISLKTLAVCALGHLTQRPLLVFRPDFGHQPLS